MRLMALMMPTAAKTVSSALHHQHGRHDDRQLRRIEERADDAQPQRNAEEDGATAQHGNGTALQLAEIGIVDNPLEVSQLDQPRVNPAHRQKRHDERYQRQKSLVCQKNLAHRPQHGIRFDFSNLQLFRQPDGSAAESGPKHPLQTFRTDPLRRAAENAICQQM